MVGDEKIERYSGRDFILSFTIQNSVLFSKGYTYFANDREAAFAITVFAKFCIAVMTSISASFVGGFRRLSAFTGTFGVQDGIYPKFSSHGLQRTRDIP